MTIKEKVKKEIENLGYKGNIEIATQSIGKLIVFVDNENIGIFDLESNKLKEEKQDVFSLEDINATYQIDSTYQKGELEEFYFN